MPVSTWVSVARRCLQVCATFSETLRSARSAPTGRRWVLVTPVALLSGISAGPASVVSQYVSGLGRQE
ncbi:MAG: hypothetical protein U0802_24300 [Candidatus Binatia bacterium]